MYAYALLLVSVAVAVDSNGGGLMINPAAEVPTQGLYYQQPAQQVYYQQPQPQPQPQMQVQFQPAPQPVNYMPNFNGPTSYAECLDVLNRANIELDNMSRLYAQLKQRHDALVAQSATLALNYEALRAQVQPFYNVMPHPAPVPAPAPAAAYYAPVPVPVQPNNGQYFQKYIYATPNAPLNTGDFPPANVIAPGTVNWNMFGGAQPKTSKKTGIKRDRHGKNGKKLSPHGKAGSSTSRHRETQDAKSEKAAPKPFILDQMNKF